MIGVADRIVVMKAHEITGVVERADATEEKVLKLAMVDNKAA